MHTTIYAICESPLDPMMVWVGTDDGNVQLTRDGGKTWTNVTKNLGLPPNAWVSSIDAGHFDKGTAYATFDLHTFGDMRPYVCRTTDFGATWTRIAGTDAGPMRGYAHVVKEDLVNKELLFVGTEFGLWVTLDGGAQWAQYKGGDLPNVAVRDLAIHPRDNDLVVATHGRGIWIIDDITPLRALTPAVLAKDAAFIEASAPVQRLQANGGWAIGDASFAGPNPTDDATITFYQKKRHIFGDLRIEVFDESGASLGTIPSGKRRGLNRVTWGMRLKAPRVPTAATGAFGASVGPRVLPGTYTVKMTKNKDVYTTTLKVLPDPRVTWTAEDRKAEFELSMKLYGMLGDMTYAVDRITGVRKALEQRAAKLPSGDPLAGDLREAAIRTEEFRKKIVATKEGGMITGEERLREYLTGLYSDVLGFEGKPSQTQLERTDALGRELGDVVADFETWAKKELEHLNASLGTKKLDTISPISREDWETSSSAK